MKLDILNRRRKIISFLDQGRADIDELSKLLDVSPMTVRRDLTILEKQGKVLRTFGGAIVRERLAYEFSFNEKAMKNKPSKELIGRIGASLVQSREMVFIDSGTTALAVAMALRGLKPCTILTPNLCVASELVGQHDISVLVTGGELSAHSPELLGEWTLQVLSGVQVDIAFLGCDAVNPKEGFYTSDLKLAAITQMVLPRSRRRFLVADSTKFGITSFCRIAPLKDLTGIITDHQLGDKYRKTIMNMGVNVYQSIPKEETTNSVESKGRSKKDTHRPDASKNI
jgi:DeoR/GlpR family transcriptional regulator of sugar metabolism